MSKKTLCKLVKDDYVKDNFKEYAELVEGAKFICKKCGRAAQKEENLCDPKKIK